MTTTTTPNPASSERQLEATRKSVRTMRRYALPLAVALIVGSVIPTKDSRSEVLLLVAGVLLLVLPIGGRKWTDSRVALFGAVWTLVLMALPIHRLVVRGAPSAFEICAVVTLAFSAFTQFRTYRRLLVSGSK